MLLEHVLAATEYEVVAVHSFDEDKAKPDSSDFDLVIADVVLRSGRGTELAALAAENGVKSLVVTGTFDEMRDLKRNQVSYLQKPFKLDEFIARVDEPLRDRSETA